MAGAAEPAFGACQVYEGVVAGRELAQMGLRIAYLEGAVRYGHERASRCLPVHPKTYQGQVMWAETVGELRTQLLDLNQDWKAGQTNNYETSYHAERGIAIAVVGGDGNTGVTAFNHPKTARKRGPITAKRIKRNVSGQLPFDLPELADPPEDDELCATWFFLLKARKEIMYSELSLPVSLGADNRIDRWAVRIILPHISLTGVAITPVDLDGGDDDDTPKIHVDRK
jgi:hypothetical protein